MVNITNSAGGRICESTPSATMDATVTTDPIPDATSTISLHDLFDRAIYYEEMHSLTPSDGRHTLQLQAPLTQIPGELPGELPEELPGQPPDPREMHRHIIKVLQEAIEIIDDFSKYDTESHD